MRVMRVPSPLTLLVGCTLIAAALTYVIPAGEYDRRNDPATGRSVVVSGTYHRVPSDLMLTGRLGFDAMTAVLISVGAAGVGSAFSPINPFQVLIAQKVAHLPQGSGAAFRLVTLVVALTLWIAGTMRYARRTRQPVEPHTSKATPGGAPHRRGGLVMGIVLVTFAVFVWGVIRLGWDFDQEAGLFFVMGVAAGVAGGLGIAGTADAFAEGFRSMTYAALLIGVARSISVVMTEGHIIDTVVRGLAAPLAQLPAGVAAVAMMAMQAIVHVPVPSVSGDAVLTLPVLVRYRISSGCRAR